MTEHIKVKLVINNAQRNETEEECIKERIELIT